MRCYFHYLKGYTYCPECGSRYLNVPGTSKSGTKCFYFVCALRHHGGGKCSMPYIPEADAESALEEHYGTLTLAPDVREEIARGHG